MKTKPKKCYNCQHSGNPFKIGKLTHMHCCHSKYKEEDFMSGKLSPWDTLMEFWESCDDHTLKPNP